MKYVFLLCSFIGISTCCIAQNIGLETKKGASGSTYTFIKKNTCKIGFTDVRPDAKDKTILACIPAAFTNTGNDHVDGAYAVNGRLENTGLINTTLGGLCYLEKNTCRIFQSQKGRLLKDSLYHLVKSAKASFFQQIQCIQNGKASRFVDQKIFQRRGIAILKDRSVAIVESMEAITLKVFSEDLALLGVEQLIYTDMGAWDEGWYRDPVSHQLVVVGKDLSQTRRQSNWIVFRQ